MSRPGRLGGPSATLGRAFSVDENEGGTTTLQKPRRAVRNGSSVVSGKDREKAKELLSAVARALRALGLYDKHCVPLSDMIVDVQNLK